MTDEMGVEMSMGSYRMRTLVAIWLLLYS